MIIAIIFYFSISIYVLFRFGSYLANRTDRVGKLYAKFFIYLQETHNLCLIRKKLNSCTQTNQSENTFISSYSKWFYHTMCLDKYRMNAYKNAVESIDEKSNWVDIGTGSHMPLTNLLLNAKIANHVHAVESNPDALKSAINMMNNQDTNANLVNVTLHPYYSTDLRSNIIPQPESIIHEIIGTVSSSEGAVASVFDLIQKYPSIRRMIPQSFGTQCVLVSNPNKFIVTWSRIFSYLYGGSTSISNNTPGIQCLYNPPSTRVWLSEPKLLEMYHFNDFFNNRHHVSGHPTKSNRIEFLILSTDKCSGLYFAPLINCLSYHRKDCEINGLLQKTNWGVEYLSFGQEILLQAGDKVEIDFTAVNVYNESCPNYTLKLYVPRIQFNFSTKWKGPQDNMMI